MKYLKLQICFEFSTNERTNYFQDTNPKATFFLNCIINSVTILQIYKRIDEAKRALRTKHKLRVHEVQLGYNVLMVSISDS